MITHMDCMLDSATNRMPPAAANSRQRHKTQAFFVLYMFSINKTNSWSCGQHSHHHPALFRHIRCLLLGTPTHNALQVTVNTVRYCSKSRMNTGRHRHTWLQQVTADCRLSASKEWTSCQWPLLWQSADQP